MSDQNWPDRNRRNEPSNSDIFTAVTASTGTIGILSGKLDDLKEDVNELKILSKSYVTHDALQLQMSAALTTQKLADIEAAKLPIQAAALLAATVAATEPKINTLWDERSFVKGALRVLMFLVGLLAAIAIAGVAKFLFH